MYQLLLVAAVVGQGLLHPTGHLIIVGGGPMDPAITRKALSLSGGAKAHVLVIPFASSLADCGACSEAMWKDAGALHIAVLDLKDHKAALAAIRQADLIWMPGGDQSRLMEALKEHGFIQAIQQRLRDGATVGGTSAGAAVMSMTMLTADAKIDRVTANTSRMAQGLGLWPDVIVDQHYLRRCRFNRLLGAVLNHPNKLGIGIDESTAVIVSGRTFEVIGQSNVMVIDARHTLEVPVRTGEPEGASNVALHLLRSGMTFNLEKGLVARPDAGLLTHNTPAVIRPAAPSHLVEPRIKSTPSHHSGQSASAPRAAFP